MLYPKLKLIATFLVLGFIGGLWSCRRDANTAIAKPQVDYQEEEVLNWFIQNQRSNGLVPSCQTCPVSLYDQALSALVFMLYEEEERAEAIFDFFNTRIDREFRQDSGGFHQFRHWNGNPVYKHQWLGDNAWLLIALNNYRAQTGSTKYDSLRMEIEVWIRKLQRSNGALIAGYDGLALNNLWVSEGIIDAYNAVPGYDSFHRGILDFLAQERWSEEQQSITTGWAPYPAALDLHPWAYGIFEDFPEATLVEADKYLNEPFAFAAGQWLKGYSFDEDRDNVWFEGTGQMAVAFYQAGYFDQWELYLHEMQKGLIAGAKDQTLGLPYASNGNSTRFGNEALSEKEYRLAFASSNAWYLFAVKGFDPFASGRDKGSLKGDRFW
jgi:hypothetical protein